MYNYMSKLMKETRFYLAKLLSNNYHHFHDLITVNYLYFHNIIKEIYPDYLEMEWSVSNNKNVNYLDLNKDITPDGLSVSVYNKTDDFNFQDPGRPRIQIQ